MSEESSSKGTGGGAREGSLSKPTRHPIAWREPGYFDEDNLVHELERVYDLCHGCRRCFQPVQLVSAVVRRDRRLAVR